MGGNNQIESMKQSRVALWLAAAGVYTLPLFLQLSTGQPSWGLVDFAFLAVLIFVPVLIYDVTTRAMVSRFYRAAMASALVVACFLLWSMASVGIIGDSADPANIAYFAVVAAALTGAYSVRLSASGMARAMNATSAVQALITALAILVGAGGTSSGPVELLAINVPFCGMWLLSAFLFGKANREKP